MAMTNWLAESIRMSFLGPMEVPDRPLFEVVSGAVPAERTSRPQQNLFQESGIYDGAHHLVIAQLPGRIDVLMSDDPTVNTGDLAQTTYKPFFEIGAYSTAAKRAEKIAHNLLVSSSLTCLRMAYAPVLISPAPSIVAANTTFKTLVPSVTVDQNKDNSIFWQINRPRKSSVNALPINRLSKWHVLVSQIISLGGMQSLVPTASKFAVRLELDINGPAATSANLEGQSTENLVRYFSELAVFAAEISERGDVP